MGTFALGTFIGPVIGGAIVARTSWHWIFYMNLPIAGVALVLVTLFLHVRRKREGTLAQRISRVDFGGNAILSASIVSILVALTWGGTSYTWSSWHILLPLLIGTLGLVLFGLHQEYIGKDPSMPHRVYGNTTSLLACVLTFLHGMAMSWLSFFLPVFFQVLLHASPMRSGVDLLTIVIPLIPAGIVGGLTVARTERFQPTIIFGYSLLTLLTQHSSTAKCAIFQIITGIGGGLALTSTLPQFGSIWGAAIPAAVFNSHFDSHLSQISDAAVREQLARGGAYEHATKVFITSFDDQPELQQEIIDIYQSSLKLVWQVLIGFALLAFPLAVCIAEVELRKELVTEFGLQEGADELQQRRIATQEPEVELQVLDSRAR
ncbi:uncharacterized protein V1518DRAFT_428535 [Limtongia smithiae]|uniref:uncharacterized protein n=1 Tax=Limtongia smithiae TaxID=1125753 RepID=UPI0034CF34B9